MVRENEFTRQTFEATPRGRDSGPYTVLPDADANGVPYRSLVCGDCHSRIPRSGSTPSLTCRQCGRQYCWGEPVVGMSFPRA